MDWDGGGEGGGEDTHNPVKTLSWGNNAHCLIIPLTQGEETHCLNHLLQSCQGGNTLELPQVIRKPCCWAFILLPKWGNVHCPINYLFKPEEKDMLPLISWGHRKTLSTYFLMSWKNPHHSIISWSHWKIHCPITSSHEQKYTPLNHLLMHEASAGGKQIQTWRDCIRQM